MSLRTNYPSEVYRYQTTVNLFSRLPSTIWYQNKFLNVQDGGAATDSPRHVPRPNLMKKMFTGLHVLK
jgi:hypothetical protein